MTGRKQCEMCLNFANRNDRPVATLIRDQWKAARLSYRINFGNHVSMLCRPFRQEMPLVRAIQQCNTVAIGDPNQPG